MATQLNNWLSIDKTSGTGNAEITLTASSYEELVDRTTSLKIQGISKNAILTVRQNAFVPPSTNAYFWVNLEEDGEIYGIVNNTIEYSFNQSTWNSFPISSRLSVPANTYVWFRNTVDLLNKEYVQDGNRFLFTKNGRVGGDLSSMGAMMEKNFQYLFAKENYTTNTYLIDASELILPWDTVSNRCFYDMFHNCSKLITPPKMLPATNLEGACYIGMFDGCKSLTTAPELPATTLSVSYQDGQTYGCYQSMFSNCSSLITAPELPATTLADGCYYYMFFKCTSLVNAPKLPATTLADSCYSYMFKDCTNLSYIKMLATEIDNNLSPLTGWVTNVAPTGTFVKAAANTNIQIDSNSGIPIGWTVYNEGDPNIPEPDVPKTEEELKQQYFWVEFVETNGTISGLTNDYTDMYHSFDGVTWEATPNTLSMGDNTLVYFKNNSMVISNYANNKITHLNIRFNKRAIIGGDLSSLTNMASFCCYYLFSGNSYLIDASQLKLSWNSIGYFSCEGMFFNCANLIAGPNILAMEIGENGCGSMFSGCKSLRNAPSILPATVLGDYCYSNMFENCTSLKTAPVLPAPTLEIASYQRMFYNCSSLNYIKMLATDINADACLSDWVDNVASTGTFIKHPNTIFPMVDGIPDGWTVETATS